MIINFKRYRTIHIKPRNRNLVVRQISCKEERNKSYRLRYDVFYRDLNWINESNDYKDNDCYDKYATSLGLFDRDKIVGSVRIVLACNPMMIENEFIDLVSESHNIKKDVCTAEVSRLCISKEIKNNNRRFAALNLYKGLYWWCKVHNIRYLYLVVEYKMYRALRMTGFPLKNIGKKKKIKKRCESVAAILDWKKLKEKSKLRDSLLKRDGINLESFSNCMRTISSIKFY